PDGSRGQVLMPWPNRVADGAYSWNGTDLQLPITEVAKHNAIHGLVRWVGWQVTDQDEASVTLSATVWPTPGYPFLLSVSAGYRLDDDGLAVELRARNDGAGAAPYGVGQHPYLLAGAPVDAVTLTLPAAARLLVDERSNPMGLQDVTGTDDDFRGGRRLDGLVLDTAFTRLATDDDGWVRARLEDIDGGGVELRSGPSARWLQVFTGDTLPEGPRRTAIAVEPMSCPPGAFRSGEDLVTLEAGAEHLLTWGLRAW
ncbi:MAG: aldose 1-epimerase family protein, partial [Sporichthyaceae bacterium]